MQLALLQPRNTEAWAAITEAVNVVSPEVRTVAQIKKKWFDIKVDAKKQNVGLSNIFHRPG